MRRLALFTALFSLFLGPLSAYCASCQNRPAGWMGHREPTSPSPLPRLISTGYWEAFGEALYLRPTPCDLDYAIADPREIPMTPSEITAWLPQGKDRLINPDHDWGVRVGIGLLSGCGDVRGLYTRYHSNQRATTLPKNSGGIWVVYARPETARFSPAFNPFFNGSPTEGISAISTATALFDYDAADLEWGLRSLLKCELAFRSSLGLHFAYIDTTFANTWQGTEFADFPTLFTEEITNRDHRRTWGVGPSAGLDAHYPLACGFGFEGHLGAALLVGNRSEHREGTRIMILLPDTIQQNQLLDVRRHNRTVLLPYLDARLGVDYIWSCESCFTLQLCLGYEFRTYINAIDVFRFNDARATGLSDCSDFSLNGLYLRVRAII